MEQEEEQVETVELANRECVTKTIVFYLYNNCIYHLSVPSFPLSLLPPSLSVILIIIIIIIIIIIAHVVFLISCFISFSLLVTFFLSLSQQTQWLPLLPSPLLMPLVSAALITSACYASPHEEHSTSL